MKYSKTGVIAVLIFWLVIAVASGLMVWLGNGPGFLVSAGILVSIFIYKVESDA